MNVFLPLRSGSSKDTEDPPITVNASTSQPERTDKYTDSRSQNEKLMSGASVGHNEASIDTSENTNEIREVEITDSFVIDYSTMRDQGMY